MIGAIVANLIILLFASTFSLYSKKKIEFFFPIATALIVAILYIFGLLGLLKAGSIIIGILGLGAIVYLAITISKRKEQFKENILRPGLVLYIVVSLAFVYLYYGIEASSWDEFSHWVDIVKVYTLYGKLGNDATQSLFASYIPGMPLFEYFYQSMNLGHFSEWLVYYAYHMFVVMMFIPILCKTEWKKKETWLLALPALALPCIAFNDVYTFALIDPIIGILSGCGLSLLIFIDEKCEASKMLMVSYAFLLVMAKSAGMLFAVMLVISLVIVTIIEKDKKWYVCLNAGGLTVAVSKVSWALYTKISGFHITFSEKIQVDELIKILLGRDDSYRTEVLQNFKGNFKFAQLGFGNGKVSFSYPTLIVAFLLAVILFGYYFYKGETKNKKVIAVSVIAFLQTCIYVFGTLVAYMFKFSEGEARRLASFTRYMNVGLAVPIILLAIVAAEVIINKKKKVMIALLVVLLFLLQPGGIKDNYLKRGIVHKSLEIRAEYDLFANDIKNIGDNSRVYIISYGDNGFDYWVLKFLLRPAQTNYNFQWSVCPENPTEYDRVISYEDLKVELFTEYDYVAVFKANDVLNLYYGDLFENGTAEEKTLYYVDNECLKLVKVQ